MKLVRLLWAFLSLLIIGFSIVNADKFSGSTPHILKIVKQLRVKINQIERHFYRNLDKILCNGDDLKLFQALGEKLQLNFTIHGNDNLGMEFQ